MVIDLAVFFEVSLVPAAGDYGGVLHLQNAGVIAGVVGVSDGHFPIGTIWLCPHHMDISAQ